MRRLAAIAIGLLPGLAGSSCGGRPAPAPEGTAPAAGAKPPNVVLILLDTLRADALPFYGNPRATAPYLARLAERATVFENAYSVSSWTAPSTASLLTGVYPDRHGVLRGFLAHFREGEAVPEKELEDLELLAISSDVETLAQRFGELGYDTYGLASNVNVGPEMDFQRGFDVFERHDLKDARFLRQRLLEWKPRMQASEAPRFLYLHFNDVHKPYELRPRFYLPREPKSEAGDRRALYESELGFLDSFLARIHEDLGFDDQTLIVVAADHGEEFGEHGRWYHEFSLHGELSWIPLVVHAPGLRVRPGRARGNVSLIDVAPTILDLVGFPVPEALDGRSLAPLCWAEDKEREPAATRDALDARPLILHRFENGQHLWGAILGRWKLIEGPEGALLYDVQADPGETVDLHEREPEVAARLAAAIQAHRERGSRPLSTRTHVEIDDELLRRLREAGYVGGTDDE